MANLLTRLTTVSIGPTGRPAAEIMGRKATAAEEEAVSRVSIFINPQALTFPVAVALVKGAWEGLKLTPLPLTGTTWFPFLACLIIGSIITINNLSAQKVEGSMRWLGVFVGVLNSLVMFAAVLGISR